MPLHILSLMLVLGAQTPAPPITPAADGSLNVPAPAVSECRTIDISLSLTAASPADPETVASAVGCPGEEPVYPLEHLVLEGLSRDGQRLWIARGADPRFARAVTAPEGTGHGTATRLQLPTIATSADVPLTQNLARIRWYEVLEGSTLHYLGEREWTPAETARETMAGPAGQYGFLYDARDAVPRPIQASVASVGRGNLTRQFNAERDQVRVCVYNTARGEFHLALSIHQRCPAFINEDQGADF